MRHLKRTAKLGRTGQHRNAMLANMVCSLIKHRRITTTLAKAKAARSVAEKMVTLAKEGTLHARRLVVSRLHEEDVVSILFKDIAPAHKDRPGGYTRIVKMLQRQGDAAKVAILEFVDVSAAAEAAGAPATTTAVVPAAPAASPAPAPVEPAATATPATPPSETK